jgi:hypothetical protein
MLQLLKFPNLNHFLDRNELPEQDQPSQNEEQQTNGPVIFRGIEFLERDHA